ncbi:MAG: hypothetical protein II205_00205 [Bacteroidales bacterium]|nr:hypothetical protein [Bacteroidales bacterium]
MEFLVVILMFALPVAMAIRDSRKRAQSGTPQVKSEPIDREAKFEYEIQQEQDFSTPLEHLFEQERTEVKPPVEAPKAIRKAAPKAKKEDVEKEQFSDRLTEAQKLVIYSEIMKPKFDK